MKFPNFKKFFTSDAVPEKRITERVHMWERVAGTLTDPATNTMHEIEIRDLSKYGVRVACDKSFPSGAPLDIEIRFPDTYSDARNIRASIKVVHSYKLEDQRRHRIGCHFVHLDGVSQAQIEKFLSWMKARAKKE